MKTTLFVHKKFPIDVIDHKLFGGFVEHIGRCVYDGIYEPGHPNSDEDGFRKDVIQLVKDLDMPLTRYPGGNFVSGFDWKDSIGPKESRPRRADYAWSAMEPNTFGIDEFVRWCRKAGTAPMVAVNLGTNTAKSAQELVEYCNFPGGTQWSDLRRNNGAESPHGIQYWCLGNEMDGPWQIGHKTAEEYGRVASEAARMMKMVDRDIKLCACGSSTRDMPTFGAWELETLRHLFDVVDFLSIHAYFENRSGDMGRFLASPEVLERQIVDVCACCDAIAAERKSLRRLPLALDEWNVWYRGDTQAHPETIWQVARPINEETYDMTDVLIIGGIIMALLNHADRVKIANIAQTVNIIAPIMTRPGGPAWKQTIYSPFLYMSRHARGVSLRQTVSGDNYMQNGMNINYLKTSTVYNAERNELVLFAINRSLDTPMDLSAEFGGFSCQKVEEAVEIHHDSPAAVNTETDEQVAPVAYGEERISLQENMLETTLKPLSWNMFRISLSPAEK